MNFGRLLFCGLILVMADNANAKYDRALDGKTKVWHNAPQLRVQPSWSGDRDEHGYATGRGILTWFKVERSWLTGSLLPSTKYEQVSQYKGKMVQGKLDGAVVSIDAKGKTYHATFADGHKTTDWLAGPLPTARKRGDQDAVTTAEVEAPAEAPPAAPQLEHHLAEKPMPSPPPQSTEPAPPAPVVSHPTASATASDDSVRSLAMPPSSLRVASLNEPAPRRSAPEADTTDKTEVSAAQNSPAPPASSPKSINDDDARTVAALDTEFHAAMKTNDAGTMDRILADDFVLVHAAGRTLSKADILKQARDKQAKYERHEIEEGTQKVRVWRDTAVVTETVWVKGAEGGKAVDQKMSVTETYVRTPDGWRYVSGQASVPAK